MCSVNKLSVAFVSAFILSGTVVNAIPSKGLNSKHVSKREVVLKQNLRNITPIEKNTEESQKVVVTRSKKKGWNRKILGKSLKDWGIFLVKGSAVTAGGFLLYNLLKRLGGSAVPLMTSNVIEGLDIDAMNASVYHKLAEQKKDFEKVLDASDLSKNDKKNFEKLFKKQENALLSAYEEQMKKYALGKKLERGNKGLEALCKGNKLCDSFNNMTASVLAANSAFKLITINGTNMFVPVSVNATVTNSTLTPGGK